MNEASPPVGEIRRVPELAWSTRLKYASIVFAVQTLVVAPVLTLRDAKEYFFPPVNRPDIVKIYPCRKKLPVRIFFPKSYGSMSGQKLPTLFTIHGGGFALGSPNDNDDWNAAFASTHSFLVIALNYGKAPSFPFPQPQHDIEALFDAALADPSLPIDPSRVAMSGWSAGGNLALTAAQLESVRTRLRATIPLYPVADFGMTPAMKSAQRRKKPALGGFRGRKDDMLLGAAPLFNWAYLPVGHEIHDPLLSPLYASRAILPKNVFIIGCELDMLAHDAWVLASRLAGRPEPTVKDTVGKEEMVGNGTLIFDDERYAFEETVDGGRYRWLLVPDMIHGFDQKIGFIARDKTLMEDAKIKTDKTIGIIGEWLSEVF